MSNFPITDRALENIESDMKKQDQFGINKYGKPLEYTDPYDWDAMANEEMADYLKYRQCERERKADVIKLLEAGMLVKNPKEYIEYALDLLTIKGTGK